MTNNVFEKGFITKREVKNIVRSEITSSVDDQKNQPNGLAGLDANGKLAISQIPGGVQQLQSQSWDASTNTPNLLTIEKQTGFIWLVGTTGNTNLSGITDWQNGDYVIYLGNDTFSKIDNSDNTSLQILNNLSDLNNKTTARGNLEVYSTSQVDTALNLKVDKITGKGLSTNDFNNTYKAQLDNFTENSQDAVGSALTDTATIDLTYDDELNQITADIKDDSINNVKIGTNADIATSKLKQAVITPQLANFSNNDTQDVINNKAQGQITNLENLINTRPIGASNGSVYYLTSQASAIPNYELLSFSPDNSPLDVESITITSATPKIDRLFHSYVSTYEVGNTIINGGNWIFNFYGYTSHINNNVFEIDVYKRDSSGIETLLFTCDTTNLLQTSQISPDLNIANAEVTKQDFSCNATDKIVVKIYAKTDRSVATTITLLHSGTDYASHIHTPIIATHNQLAGAQGGTATEKYHLTLADYNSVLGLSASLNAKADKVDFESAIKFYVAKNGNDLNNGSLIKPFATIQKALSVIPVATNSTDNRLVYTIHIASGTYDEDLSIDIGRKKVILFPEAGAKLGSFNASNWLPTSSINGRNINITCSQTSLDSIRPLFAIISNNNTSSSTHQAYSGGFQISGSLIISQSVSVSGEFLFKGITFFGYDGSVNGANPSINTTGWGGNCNFYLERCRLYGQITGTSLRLQNAFDCRFDALISLATYSQIRNTEINAGMTWLVAPSEVQPIGVYNSRLVGVFTGNTNINLLVDLASNYSFNSNSATLGINTKKILLGTFNNKNIYVSGGVNGTGNDSNDGFTELTALNTLAVANSRLGNTGEKLILLPSQLTESVTFTQQNIEVSGQNASHRGLCGTTGTITANHSGSSQTYSYLNVANFVKSSSQYTILYDVAITGNFSDNGGGVVDAYNLIFNASSVINITGSGIKNFYNQRGGVFNVNNASAQVNVVSFDYISQFNLTAGTLSLRNCIVYIAQGTTFTIGSSGSTFFAENVRFLYPDNSKAKINIPAGVNYSLQNGCIYDIANSTLSGTNIASLYTGYFDNISLNTVNLKSGIASTILATDVNKNIQSLSTTTYPNLTELSYVKGLTSDAQTQLNAKEGTITAGTTSQYFRGDKTFATLDKTAVGLSNVDNTSDINKPISTATQTALNSKENAFTKNTAFNQNFGNTAGTVCEGNDARLGTKAIDETNIANNKILVYNSTSQKLEYQDKPSAGGGGVLEYDTKTNFPTTGTAGQLYLAKDTNLIFRWTGSAYVEVSPASGGGGDGDPIGTVKIFSQPLAPSGYIPAGTYNSPLYPVLAGVYAGGAVQPVQETAGTGYFPYGSSDRMKFFPDMNYAESETGTVLYLDLNSGGNGGILTNNPTNTDLEYRSYSFQSYSGGKSPCSVAWVKDQATNIGYFVTLVWSDSDYSLLRITEEDLLANANWTVLPSRRPGGVGVLSSNGTTLIYTPMGQKTGLAVSTNAGNSFTAVSLPVTPVNLGSVNCNLLKPVWNGNVWFMAFPGTWYSATSPDGFSWIARNNLQTIKYYDGSGSITWSYQWHVHPIVGGNTNRSYIYITAQSESYSSLNYMYTEGFYSVDNGVTFRLCNTPGFQGFGFFGGGFMAPYTDGYGTNNRIYYSSNMNGTWQYQTFSELYVPGQYGFVCSKKYNKAYLSSTKFRINFTQNATFVIPNFGVTVGGGYVALIKAG